MSAWVSANDLAVAADWLESYDMGEDDGSRESMARVAAWLRAEVAQREAFNAERQVRAIFARHLGLPANDPRITELVKRHARRTATN